MADRNGERPRTDLPQPRVPCAPVVALDDPVATDPAVAGAKAANLARCAAATLRVLPGFVLTTEGTRRGLEDPAVRAALRHRWEELGGDGPPLVVRSSSTIEDAGTSSMAGQFTSVLDVRGWEGFLAAVAEVMASGLAIRDRGGVPRPMGVLVQRQLNAVTSGVLFGVDPVTGDRDHLAVDVVAGRPDRLVGGEVVAEHHVLTRRGSAVHPVAGAEVLPRALRRELAHIAFQGLVNFRSAQDMEWAVDGDGTLWVLQSRPVTAVTPTRPGPLMGPGPVAETFPAPLTELEVDLWAEPLREGILRALRLTGAAARRDLEASPVLGIYGGRAAVDLELIGSSRAERSFAERWGPSALVRHLRVAWRVGRTRAALPALGEVLLSEVDDHLGAVPPLDDLDTRSLADIVDRTRAELAVVHTAEVLSGMLLPPDDAHPPAGLVAVAALAAGRARGLDEAAVIAASPEVLSLRAPTTGSPVALPEPGDLPPPPPAAAAGVVGVDDLGLRDALRLRTRWLQELAGRAAMELAARPEVAAALAADAGGPGAAPAADAGGPGAAEAARHLHWEELRAVQEGHPPPPDLAERAGRPPGPPLPNAFRVTEAGRILAEQRGGSGAGAGAGLPAGGGRVMGTTCHRVTGAQGPPEARVLVIDHLVPELAPLLGQVDALVSETGSPLSHLAILAREAGVATVVGVPDARRRFPAGLRVVVDGMTGEVAVLDGSGEPGSVGTGVAAGAGGRP